MKILLEDSTTGKKYWELINKCWFNNYFEVINRNGNVDVSRYITEYIKTGGSELHVVIVDRMVDKNETRETYEEIQDKIKGHKNFIMPVYGCLEREMMTYKNLSLMVGDTTSNRYKLLVATLESSSVCGVVDKKKLRRHGSIVAIHFNDHSELMYKNVLADYTNQTLAQVSKGGIGKCWTQGCCKPSDNTEKMYAKKCMDSDFKDRNVSILEKTCSIVEKSEFKCIVDQIVSELGKYAMTYYSPVKYDTKYKGELSKYNKVELVCKIAKYLENNGAWSYKEIYENWRNIK